MLIINTIQSRVTFVGLGHALPSLRGAVVFLYMADEEVQSHHS